MSTTIFCTSFHTHTHYHSHTLTLTITHAHTHTNAAQSARTHTTRTTCKLARPVAGHKMRFTGAREQLLLAPPPHINPHTQPQKCKGNHKLSHRKSKWTSDKPTS
jgi:hypothetical protein